jgi:hypothetical protein
MLREDLKRSNQRAVPAFLTLLELVAFPDQIAEIPVVIARALLAALARGSAGFSGDFCGDIPIEGFSYSTHFERGEVWKHGSASKNRPKHSILSALRLVACEERRAVITNKKRADSPSTNRKVCPGPRARFKWVPP